MPRDWRLVGTAEQDFDDEGFRDHARESIEQFGRDGVAEGDFEDFRQAAHLRPVAAGAEPSARRCAAREAIDGEARCCTTWPCRHPPSARSPRRSADSSLTGPEARVIMEKPFGHDYAVGTRV